VTEDTRHEAIDLRCLALRGIADDAFRRRRRDGRQGLRGGHQGAMRRREAGWRRAQGLREGAFLRLVRGLSGGDHPRAAVGKACKADVKQFCANVKPGKGAIADCMKSHVADISDGCKEALAKAEAGNK
jgi:hypothetical protein